MAKKLHPARDKTGYLVNSAILLPVAGYLLYAWYFSGSLFYADDFHLLKTVQWARETPVLAEKIKLLYHQHQEHRIVVPRLLTFFDYIVEGHINWRTLILFANLAWCATLFLLWKAFASLQISRWYFIPVPWLLFHPQYHENVTWAISILQQSDIVFLFTLLAYLCSKRKYNLALVLSLVATFTHGNGIFSFPIAIAFTLIDRDWKNSVKLLSVMLIVAFFYFYDFKAGQNASVGRSLADPLNLVRSFGVFFGGITLIVFNSYALAAIFGLAATGALLVRSVISLRRKLSDPEWSPLLLDKMLWGITAFLFITGSLVVITRSWLGVEAIAAPRYLHYTSYVACIAYLVLLRVAAPDNRKWLGVTLLPVGILLCLLSYLNFTPYLHLLRDRLVADQSNYLRHGVFLQYFPSFNENIKETYANALAGGVVRMEDKLNESVRSESDRPDIRLTVGGDSLRLEDSFRAVTVQAARIGGEQRPGRQVFLVAKSGETETPYWIAVYTQRAAYRALLSSGALRGTGFEGTVILNNLRPGSYRLGVYADGHIAWTGTYLPVP